MLSMSGCCAPITAPTPIRSCNRLNPDLSCSRWDKNMFTETVHD